MKRSTKILLLLSALILTQMLIITSSSAQIIESNEADLENKVFYKSDNFRIWGSAGFGLPVISDAYFKRDGSRSKTPMYMSFNTNGFITFNSKLALGARYYQAGNIVTSYMNNIKTIKEQSILLAYMREKENSRELIAIGPSYIKSTEWELTDFYKNEYVVLKDDAYGLLIEAQFYRKFNHLFAGGISLFANFNGFTKYYGLSFNFAIGKQ